MKAGHDFGGLKERERRGRPWPALIMTETLPLIDFEMADFNLVEGLECLVACTSTLRMSQSGNITGNWHES